MTKTILQGRLKHQLRSLAALLGITAKVLARRLLGRPLVPQWNATFEIGTLFFRHQFNHAFELATLAEGRAYFDSLYSVVMAKPQVDIQASAEHEPRGEWFIPLGHTSDRTMLYFHGGGYAFYGAVSRHFIAMLAHMLKLPIFAPDYRLAPEHCHPAQLNDALAAYRHLLDKGISPKHIIFGGDSAGGHLALMLVSKLQEARLPHPALVVGLSPWTDISSRGESLFGNVRYDMVQGYQPQRFADWFKGHSGRSDAELSPMHQTFQGAPPIYLQAGGKEILVDMIRDFAKVLQDQGTPVRLDVWEHMNHEFHAYGDTLTESSQAIDAIRQAIYWATASNGKGFPRSAHTVVDTLGTTS